MPKEPYAVLTTNNAAALKEYLNRLAHEGYVLHSTITFGRSPVSGVSGIPRSPFVAGVIMEYDPAKDEQTLEAAASEEASSQD